MKLVAFLHGYPPFWSMGGEVSTHRTLSSVKDATVVVPGLDSPYEMDGVTVVPGRGSTVTDIKADAVHLGATVLFSHSTMSSETVQAARSLKLPSILAVHAPPKYGQDIRRAWSSSTARLYNTEVARRDWRDSKGWLLHPPIWGSVAGDGPRDAYTSTSSLLNKGANRVLKLAEMSPDKRFIIVESPAHSTHGDPDFWGKAEELHNVEVWPRVEPWDMGVLWAETRMLLVPSRYETYGMAALEAAFNGIPSVHVDTPHVREGIGEAARLLKTVSVRELDQAVQEVDQDYGYWSNRARNRYEELLQREQRELDVFATRLAALNP